MSALLPRWSEEKTMSAEIVQTLVNAVVVIGTAIVAGRTGCMRGNDRRSGCLVS
jgi:hypothetical protein